MSRNRTIGLIVGVLVLVAGILVVAGDDDDADRVSADATSSTRPDATSTTADREKDDSDLVIPTGLTVPPSTTTSAAAPAPGPTAPPETSAPNPTVPPPTPLGQIPVRLTGIVTLSAPIAMVPRPGSGELWVAEQGGRVVALRGGVVPTVDISGDTEANGEQGLLGLAFDGSGSRLYLSYTDNSGDSRVHEFTVSPAGAVDPASRRELLFVDQPYANHNGGNVVLGPDGAIWLGLGDGGSGGDPQGHAQRDGDPLGKLLRHTPGGSGFDIVAKGLRNPWRFSFDRSTGDLWLADVGQSEYEEINAIPFGAVSGADFGWNRREGAHPYNGGSEPGDTEPVHEYSHARGCSVTGGFVYRGAAIPALVGTYLYGDYCESAVRGLRVGSEDVELAQTPGEQLASFAQDLGGELYVLSLAGGIYRIDPA